MKKREKYLTRKRKQFPVSIYYFSVIFTLSAFNTTKKEMDTSSDTKNKRIRIVTLDLFEGLIKCAYNAGGGLRDDLQRLTKVCSHSPTPPSKDETVANGSLSNADMKWIADTRAHIKTQRKASELPLIEFEHLRSALDSILGDGWPHGARPQNNAEREATWRACALELRLEPQLPCDLGFCDHAWGTSCADATTLEKMVFSRLPRTEARIHRSLLRAMENKLSPTCFFLNVTPDQSLHDWWMASTKPILDRYDFSDLAAPEPVAPGSRWDWLLIGIILFIMLMVTVETLHTCYVTKYQGIQINKLNEDMASLARKYEAENAKLKQDLADMMRRVEQLSDFVKFKEQKSPIEIADLRGQSDDVVNPLMISSRATAIALGRNTYLEVGVGDGRTAAHLELGQNTIPTRVTPPEPPRKHPVDLFFANAWTEFRKLSGMEAAGALVVMLSIGLMCGLFVLLVGFLLTTADSAPKQNTPVGATPQAVQQNAPAVSSSSSPLDTGGLRTH